MLTAAQCATEAWMNESGEFYHEECIEDYVRPVSQYELHEHDAEMSSDIADYGGDGLNHAEYCSCTYGIQCYGCNGDIIAPYTDPDCEEEDDDESDTAFD